MWTFGNGNKQMDEMGGNLHVKFPLYVTKQFMLAAEQSNNFDFRYYLNLNVEREQKRELAFESSCDIRLVPIS
jgi:hypothetical protein